jgi:hypothetical protein
MGIRLIGREQERDMLWVAPWEPAHLSSLVEYAIHQGSQQILRHQRDGKRSYTGARYRLCGITCAQCDTHRARDAQAGLRFEATTAFLPTLAVRSRCLQRQLNVDSSRPVGAKSGRRRSSSATSGSVRYRPLRGLLRAKDTERRACGRCGLRRWPRARKRRPVRA